MNSGDEEIEVTFDEPLSHCPLCRHEGLRLSRIDYKGIRIDRCQGCGTEFMNPRYTDQHLHDLYNQYQSQLVEQHHFGDDLKPRELIHDYNLAQIEEFRPPGKFLSVGCGKGVDLTVAAKRGWSPEGFDVDADYVEEQSKKTGIPIRSGEFCQLEYPPSSFECVYLNHVLEHPKNPGDYLDAIGKILTKGGILYIACPNVGSPSGLLKNLQDSLRLRKKTAKHYDTWHHLTYFTPHRLARVLERNYGYRVLYLGSDIKAHPGDDAVREAPLAKLCLKSTFRLIAQKD